jgi:hypothetical protein
MSGKIFFKANSEARNLASWKIVARLVASTILDAAKAILGAVVSRWSVNTLATWDDRMLKDIGLTRGDLDGALAQPWHRDPSRELMVRRLENRVRARSKGSAGHHAQHGAADAIMRDQESERLRNAPCAGRTAKELN